MKVKAAVLRESPGKWSVEDVELDEPKEGEVLIQMVAAGICHSDDHTPAGDLPVGHYPMVGGHEGAGIVRKAGPGVHGLEVGDHVVTSFIPGCGRCRWCAAGMQNLCDHGALILLGHQLDGTYRMHTADGEDAATWSLLGTFAEWQVVDQVSCVKIDPDFPLDLACLLACGVQTGFGSATTAGDVQAGDVVVVIGVGGVGINAVQGATVAGAGHVLAVDPLENKRSWALDFGATESFATMDEASPRIAELTNGQGADVVIVTAGVVTNAIIGEGYQAVRKAGTLVVTGVSPHDEDGPVPGMNALNLAMFQKRIQGALYGMKSPREAIPRLIELYRAGRIKLDQLVTTRYELDSINEAFDDLRGGRNIRGIITFDC